MSRAVGLVKFPDDKVVICCYDGTSDFMYSPLITADDIDKNFDGDVFDWSDKMFDDHLDEINARESLAENDAVNVLIYSDYGGGFWWAGKASPSQLMITEGNDGYGADWLGEGTPDWAQNFLDDWYGR